MGWNAQPTAQVIFEGVRVPADAMLGGADGEGTGFGIAMNGLNGGRLNIAACSLGGAQAAYDKAASYLADRQAFGGSLLDEPTIRFTLADMATALETSRILLWRAATALDDDDPDKVELCAMAKRYVTDACFDVADQALQLHGGYGYLREYGLEKIVRDLRVHRILEGTNEIMRVVIGRAEAARARASAITRRRSDDDDRVPGAGQHGRPDGGQPRRGRPHRARLRPGRRAAEAAAEKGATVFDSGAEAVADADVVITSLPNGAIVKACYAEVLPAAPGRARCSSTPRRSRSTTPATIHAQATERGFAQLDAPVSGGVKGATAGTLAFMVGGEDDAVERAPPGAGTDGGQDHSLRRLRRRARPPSCATTWCSPCSRSRSARRSCWPRSSACPRSRCST